MCCRISIETTCLLSQSMAFIVVFLRLSVCLLRFSGRTYIRVSRINIETVLHTYKHIGDHI